jgi:type IV fimbrial biogenesis protein FimT
MSTPASPDPGHAAASCRGFTFIEIIAVVAILSMLAAVAIPGLGSIVERYRIRRASEDLGASLFLARTEAIRRGGNITLRRATSTACPAASDWSCGWLIFVDADNDGIFDPGEQPVQVSPAPKGVAVKMKIANPADLLKVNRWGRFNDTIGAFSVKLSPAGQPDSALAIILCMSTGGRLRNIRPPESCD